MGYEQARNETQYTLGEFGMDLMKSRRLSMRRTGYTTPHATCPYGTVDACRQRGYAARDKQGAKGPGSRCESGTVPPL